MLRPAEATLVLSSVSTFDAPDLLQSVCVVDDWERSQVNGPLEVHLEVVFLSRVKKGIVRGKFVTMIDTEASRVFQSSRTMRIRASGKMRHAAVTAI